MKKLLALALSLSSLTGLAPAQSEVVGIYYDLTHRQVFQSTTDDFVGGWWGATGIIPLLFYGIDFEHTGTTLYAISYSQGYWGTLDQTTGAFTNMGTSGLPTNSVYGLAAHPDGTTWYAICRLGSDSQLYQGTMGGTWTAVGSPTPGLILWDISCDSTGQLFAHSGSTDSLYSIDPVTGVITLVGPLGLNLEYAQGFDFDWTDDTLYATLSLSLAVGGGSKFSSIDTTTGAATVIADAGALYAQAEMAIKQPAPGLPGTEPFCDAYVNSTGLPTLLTGDMTAPSGSGLHLEATQGPVDQFGYFLVSSGIADPGIDISEGRLCLAVNLGRYNMGPLHNSIGQFDPAGILQNLAGTSSVGSGFDVPDTVPILGTPLIMAGDTWHFQVWHRDIAAGPTASNFSNGLSVTF
ncbi:MAG: hypothetical protein P1V35_16420 [Planctomycetota bacterium]|nr:hypothetical protein [Planctomycetota bacterium]